MVTRSKPHTMSAAMAVLAICLAALTGASDAQAPATSLRLLFSIQRHGARNVLPKTSLLLENSTLGGPTLLPKGQRMCYDAGAWEVVCKGACVAGRA